LGYWVSSAYVYYHVHNNTLKLYLM
jgi:hypothetical protein